MLGVGGTQTREALTTWAVREDLTEEVTWSWGLKEEQEFASQEGKGRGAGRPCSSHPRGLLRTPDESALPRGLPSLMGETFWGPDGCSPWDSDGEVEPGWREEGRDPPT